jgi:hypothetical protein
MRPGTKVECNSRIQFASNESKLVPRKLDPAGPSSKVGLKEEALSNFLSLIPWLTEKPNMHICFVDCILTYIYPYI